jgi:hypothetical protein
MVKLLMNWDIQAGREAEYFQFIIQDFVPGLLKLGLQLTEVWFTAFGDCPQIQAGGLAPDVATIQNIVGGTDWQELRGKLEEYVTDYRQKVILAEGGFQL